MTSNSERLRNRIMLALPSLTTVGYELVEHPRFAEMYSDYAFAIHSMIRASVPLMEAALKRAVALAEEDKLRPGLVDYYSQHIREELHHDDWLLDDLAVLGFDRGQILARMPSPTVAAVVGSQYYWLHHYHPVVLLGYIAILEGYPPTAQQIEDMIVRTGHPREAMRTLMKHAHLDPHHRDDLNAALDQLPLTDGELKLVALNALQTMKYLREVYGEILKAHQTVTVGSEQRTAVH